MVSTVCISFLFAVLLLAVSPRAQPFVKCPQCPMFFGRAPPLFGSKSTISRFGERFRDGQYSLVSFLFAVLLLVVPLLRAQPFVKVGARAPVPHGVGATVSCKTFSVPTIVLLISTFVFHFNSHIKLQCA